MSLYPHSLFLHQLLVQQPAKAEMIVAELALVAWVYMKEVHQRPVPARRGEMVCMFVPHMGKRLDFARIDWVVVLVVET